MCPFLCLECINSWYFVCVCQIFELGSLVSRASVPFFSATAPRQKLISLENPDILEKTSCKRSSKLGYWFSLCWISEELWLEVRASGLGKFLVDAGLDSLGLAVSVASPPASFPYTAEGVFSRTLIMTCFWSLSGYACTSTNVASEATGSEGFCTRFVAGDFGCEPTCKNSTFQSTQWRQRTTRRRWGCTRSALRASCGRDLSVSQRRRKVCQTVWP